MSTAPTVAVCIATCRQAQYLGRAVRSALTQSYPVQEVWVANDASDDDTEAVLADLAREDARLRWFTNPTRLGVCRNVDTVLRKPKTDLVIRLDSDDCLGSGYAEEMLRLFEKYPQAGIFHCDTREIDREGRVVRLRRRPRREEYQSADSQLREAPFRYGVTANICGFRRSLLEAVNFTQGRPDYLEDYDLWSRAAAAGYGNVFSSRLLADYRVWADQGGVRLRRKHTELEGLIRLFDEVLLPAYQARGWPEKLLARGRRRHALQHASYLAEVDLSDDESAAIASLLKRLSSRDFRIDLLTAIGCSPVRKVLLWEKALRVGLWRAKTAAACKLAVWRERAGSKGPRPDPAWKSATAHEPGPTSQGAVPLASVAVCIPTCNQALYLRTAVESALSQTYPITEVWVANDRSDDNTEEVLAELSRQDPRVKFFTNPSRLGIARNVDTVLSKSKADFIIRCDSDDCLHASYAAEMVRLLKLHPDAAAFHCNVREIDGAGAAQRMRLHVRKRTFQSGEDALKEAAYRYTVTANICGFRREALEKVGFARTWSERAEDYHRWVQLACAGYGNVFSGKVLADYRVWLDGRGERLQRKSAELKGLIQLFEDVLSAEYRARGWPATALERGRRRHAIQHVPYLAEVNLTEEESQAIVELLNRLSGNSALVRALAAMGHTPLRGALLLLKAVRVHLWRMKQAVLRMISVEPA